MTLVQTHIPRVAHRYVWQTSGLWRVLLSCSPQRAAVCPLILHVPNVGRFSLPGASR